MYIIKGSALHGALPVEGVHGAKGLLNMLNILTS